MTDLVDAVCGYARRFHGSIGEEHHVASPLGAWLVLALTVSAATGPERDELEAVLGCGADEAGRLARELLGTSHSSVRLAAAAWHRRDAETPSLTDWLAGIAHVARTGPVPSQDEADRWADEITGGLIKNFPVRIDTETLLVLASAIACAVSWQQEFIAVDVAELRLPLTAAFDGLRRMLRDPGSADHQAIVASEVGLLGVHATSAAEDDLLVVSVIADAEVRAAQVLEQAHRVAVAAISHSTLPGAQSLFDLDVGAGHAWTITERTATVSSPDGRDERFEATLLPAWSAESEHDLSARPELGFGAAAAALAALLPSGPRGHAFEAKQVALARYTRTGFEAAAVTGMALRAASIREGRDGLVRTARLEFVRPYAAVAIARDAVGRAGPWAGLPVFSAWVSTPDEAD